MSRILVFDLENRISGEVHAKVNRGWMIADGGSATFTLSDDEALLPCMQLGRMVFVDGGGLLPNWAGMIDTPWGASSPVSITAYDVPYMLSRRCLYVADQMLGNTREIALRIVAMAHQPGDLYIREGDMQDWDAEKMVEVGTTAAWEELKKMVADAGMEMAFRSEIDSERRLVHYLDIQKTLGIATQLVLQDGEGGNVTFGSATVDGEFWNAVMGINSGSTGANQLSSDVVHDTESEEAYRVRNKVMQFTTASKTDLKAFTENYVAANGKPMVTLRVKVRDAGDTFSQLRLGNTLAVRATNLILPGGKRGWTGPGRILGMNYDEGSNQISMTLTGAL